MEGLRRRPCRQPASTNSVPYSRARGTDALLRRQGAGLPCSPGFLRGNHCRQLSLALAPILADRVSWLRFWALPSSTAARRRSPFGLALLALIPLGGFYLQARDAAAPTIAENLQPFATGDDAVDVTAYVIREGLVRDSPYGGKQESVDVDGRAASTR